MGLGLWLEQFLLENEDFRLGLISFSIVAGIAGVFVLSVVLIPYAILRVFEFLEILEFNDFATVAVKKAEISPKTPAKSGKLQDRKTKAD